MYFTLCKSNGPPCPYVCNGPGRRFPQKIWKTHFLCLPSNIIRRGGIASSALKGRRSILNLDVRTNLEANLNAYCCRGEREFPFPYIPFQFPNFGNGFFPFPSRSRIDPFKVGNQKGKWEILRDACIPTFSASCTFHTR